MMQLIYTENGMEREQSIVRVMVHWYNLNYYALRANDLPDLDPAYSEPNPAFQYKLKFGCIPSKFYTPLNYDLNVMRLVDDGITWMQTHTEFDEYNGFETKEKTIERISEYMRHQEYVPFKQDDPWQRDAFIWRAVYVRYYDIDHYTEKRRLVTEQTDIVTSATPAGQTYFVFMTTVAVLLMMAVAKYILLY